MDGGKLPPIPGRRLEPVYPPIGATGSGVGIPTPAQPALSTADFTFGYGDDRPTSTFNPTTQYMAFKDRYREYLQPNNIRSFFLHARDAKRKMANVNKEKVRLTFGTLTVELVNNHRPAQSQRVVLDHELTLYRLTGYIARFLFEQILGDASWGEAARVIINPISAKLGITWEDGADIYLSTLPGTEMFLGEFSYYPLAFMILRIKRGEIPAAMAKKALRQRVDGKLAAQWMVDDVAKVDEAVKKVEQIKPVFNGITETMTAFLRHFGIRMPESPRI
ncbi:N [Nola virus]|uniref:Nucleoprotein n=1 Tax=Nola virus TaxID=442713 RepID=A0A7D9MVI9_9VIRU|nr:N [Nola virus] [Nola virus]QLA46911.1 N [Nola virus] [Nola virus]